MRTIKFRGKTTFGLWVYGDLVINKSSETYRIFTDFACVKHGDYSLSSLHECSGELNTVTPATVGQFTGLTDKNGKEIYEGDVCHAFGGTEFNGMYEMNVRGFIEYSSGAFYLSVNGVCYDLGNIEYIEVIGNIHDNPQENEFCTCTLPNMTLSKDYCLRCMKPIEKQPT